MEELWLRGGEEGAGLLADRLPGSGLNGFGYLSARFSGLRAKPANKLDIKTSLSLSLSSYQFPILENFIYSKQNMKLFFRWDFGRFFFLSVYCTYIQHCFICRPSDSSVSEDAGIAPRTVATSALAAVRRSNHSATSHLQLFFMS